MPVRSAIDARCAAIGFVPSTSDALNIVAMVDGAVAGQGRIVPIDATSAAMGGIHVLPAHAGQGIARRLVAALLERADVPTLYCLPFADLAAFYQSMGFRPIDAHDGVPAAIREKLRWCLANYDQPVSLLARYSHRR